MLDPTAFTWYDTDANGLSDAGYLDTNGDGYAESSAFDLDQNGVIDAVTQDADANGIFETIWVDQDGSGNFATLGSDLDQNGTIDQVTLPDGTVVSATSQSPYDVIQGNTFVGGGGNSNALLNLPESAYTDPITGPMIQDIFDSQTRTTGIWTLPDGWEYEYDYD